MPTKSNNNDFDSIRISVASPKIIKKWSHGEVTKPETINYRTQKPEKDGLFCERIFGPSKDYECYCGKYKRIRYKGVVCDKCGVEVTKAAVRRERMGHIQLAVPATHIWYIRGVPSKIGLVLDLSVRELERVIYFASYIILDVSEDIRKKALADLESEFKKLKSQFRAGAKVSSQKLAALKADGGEDEKQFLKIKELETAYLFAKREIKNLKPKQIISEKNYLDSSLKYGQVIKVGIGAEAIYELLKRTDINKEIKDLKDRFKKKGEQESKKSVKRLRILLALKAANIKPEWMVLTALPVIPPDLRPMVQLDGGRFAASDLNDLYRRVINRNNRLKRLIEQKAPEVICRNEKRMLQEAVDALIDNSARRDKSVVTTAGRRKLKSLSDMLKGKQGRFRQNLLGKRVDYSGRSVIVVGPQLKLSQVGLPKSMALELFKPFVISKLIAGGFAHNVKNATRLLERQTPEVWDILEGVIKNHLVLLNRAPTLHRLGIQAFQPVLIEGKAIQIHPLACAAYNADFDGDQMAVHIPLSKQANFEASQLMHSVKNLLKPASGEPIITPLNDMVLGCYYLTNLDSEAKGEGKSFTNFDEAMTAFENSYVSLRALISVKDHQGNVIKTSIGRIIFNHLLPVGMRYKNIIVDKKKLRQIVAECFAKYGSKQTVELVDNIKQVGFHYATQSGITFALDDVKIPSGKNQLIKESKKELSNLTQQYSKGLITDFERYLKTVDLWTRTKTNIKKAMIENFAKDNPVYMMVTSGSRGTLDQLVQIAGMKGLVANPAGKIIELPVLANYKEGLTEFEYFISSHGARKGKSDTALRTADAGYLTRRLIDVAQDIIITQEDCGTGDSIEISRKDTEEVGEDFKSRILGRIAAASIKDPKTKKKILSKNKEIGEAVADEIIKKEVPVVKVRSILTCKAVRGICQKCYGRDLATGTLVDLGTAVGIIAAQAIGEPGTQLTMRTFHIGGIAGEDITQGLPRVEELFEARNPKMPAVISEIAGKISISLKEDKKIIRVKSDEKKTQEYGLTKEFEPVIKSDQKVKTKQILATCRGKRPLRAVFAGEAKIEKNKIILKSNEYKSIEYQIPARIPLRVSENDLVDKGTPLTEGFWNLTQMLKLVGKKRVEGYIIKEIKNIYSSQGQTINDKHIELIVKQIFSKVEVKNPGDSGFLSNQMVNRMELFRINDKLKKQNKTPASYEDLILGVTKVALNTKSFLSAASFQETTRILIDAATKGKTDSLKGLKENVIIGRLIPAGTGFAKSIIQKELDKIM